MDEIDSVPCIEELNVAIGHLTNDKALGFDNVKPDLIKTCKSALLLPLYEILCQCWQEGEFSQDIRDAKIITLYKNKGEPTDSNSYRGIFSYVLWVRALHVLYSFDYNNLQNKYIRNHSVDFVQKTDQQLICFFQLVSCRKISHYIFHSLILQKVPCGVLYNTMGMCLNFLKFLMVSSKVLSLTLFENFFLLLLKQAFGTVKEGIYLHTRTDGKLFSPSRLKAKTKVKKTIIRDILFADDAAIAAHIPSQLQALKLNFVKFSKPK